jgi:hypothetical protein
MKLLQTGLLVAVPLLATVLACRAAPPTEETARAAVERFLVEHKINPRDNWIQNHHEIQEAVLAKTLQDHRFYLLRFRQWPVPRDHPPPLAANNLLAVSDTLEVTLITDAEELLKFFKQRAPADDKERTAIAWALLHKELLDDGLFHLQVRPDSVQTAKTENGDCVSVTVAPARSDNTGQCVFTLRFDADGRIVAHEVQNNLKAGIRPICQSMLLNDPDQPVRENAERDLMMMGRDALPYLRERLEVVPAALAEKIRALIRRLEDAR